MKTEQRDDHVNILIRDFTVLARVPADSRERESWVGVEFYDVRTGVRLKEIHPPLRVEDLDRGYPLPDESAQTIIRSGSTGFLGPDADPSKVVSILDLRQRRLDSVVADSIFDQLRVIRDILDTFLRVADDAEQEERLWLSQQLLTMVRKFSGRELEELEEIARWFRSRPKK